jgi:plastocyanin
MSETAWTRAAVVAVFAVLSTLLGAGPARAHGVLEEEKAVLIGDLHSEITTSQLPAEVSAQLLENGYALRLVNRSAHDVTAEAAAGGENTGGDEDAAAPLTVAAGDTVVWTGAPSAVTDEDADAAQDADAGDQVRAWTVTLTASGEHYQLRGVIREIASPSSAWLVVGVLAILLVLGLVVGLALRSAVGSTSGSAVGSTVVARPARLVGRGLLAFAVAGFAAETVATVAARAGGEGWLDMTREYLPQLGVCLLGVVTWVLVWREHRLATVLSMITLLGVAAGVVSRWPVLWSSVAVTELPISVDRVLVLAISAAALSAATRVVLGEVRARSAPEPAATALAG